MISQTYHITHINFWKAYWIMLRPYLTFISGTAGLVGLAFIPEPKLFPTILSFFILFFSYGFGQALTDCFQTDTDAKSSPYRPLVQGVISKKQVLVVSLFGLLSGTLILACLNIFLLIPALLAVIGLSTYTAFKRTWWGGPPWNSWIVALLPLIARMTDKNINIANLLDIHHKDHISFWIAVSALFFAYLNFVIMGYFKDISADRATGYRTFPVVFGWKANAIYSDITAFISTFCTLFVLVNLPAISPIGLCAFIIAAGLILKAQFQAHFIRDEKKIHGPITNVVRAFILYGLSIIVALKPHWLILLVIFYACFEINLGLRPQRTQV